MNLDNNKIVIIELGYVGLPLAVAFAEKYPVVVFDINQNRVNELLEGVDNALEIESIHLQSVLKTAQTNGNGFFQHLIWQN
jgi:UDP-N-acetyl-D-galactosamine dehydrogenase